MSSSRLISNLILGSIAALITQISIVNTPVVLLLNRLQLGTSAVAIPEYVRRRGDPPRQTLATGPRGCSVDQEDQEQPTLSVLTDSQTTLAHPVFFWHLSTDASTPVEFTLVEPGNPEPVYALQVDAKVGITAIEIPENIPELMIGKQYRWSVALICNPVRRSSDVIAQGQIDRVEPPQPLVAQLATATSDQERAEIYAANGFWMDSMAAYEAALKKAPNDTTLVQDQLLLLEQVGEFTNVVQQERQRLGINATSSN